MSPAQKTNTKHNRINHSVFKSQHPGEDFYIFDWNSDRLEQDRRLASAVCYASLGPNPTREASGRPPDGQIKTGAKRDALLRILTRPAGIFTSSTALHAASAAYCWEAVSAR